MNQIKSFHFLGMSLLLLASASLSGACRGSLALRPPTPTFAARAHIGSGPTTTSADRYAAPPAAAAPQGSSAQPELPPAMAQIPREGPMPSHDPATAPFITLGEPLRSVVSEGAPVYYKVRLKRGQTTKLTGLMGKAIAFGSCNPEFRLVDPEGVAVLSVYEGLYAPVGEFERMDDDQGATPIAGDHILKISTNGGSVDYKIRLESPDA